VMLDACGSRVKDELTGSLKSKEKGFVSSVPIDFMMIKPLNYSIIKRFFDLSANNWPSISWLIPRLWSSRSE
jgi:hypothetical protein